MKFFEKKTDRKEEILENTGILQKKTHLMTEFSPPRIVGIPLLERRPVEEHGLRIHVHRVVRHTEDLPANKTSFHE